MLFSKREKPYRILVLHPSGLGSILGYVRNFNFYRGTERVSYVLSLAWAASQVT